MVSVLRVTPEAVEQSGGQVAEVPSAAVPAAQVTAAASEPVSVSVAYALGTRIAVIGAQSTTAHAETQQAAARLNANATDYVTQEQANTAGLGVGAATAAVGVSAPDAPIPTAPPALPAQPAARGYRTIWPRPADGPGLEMAVTTDRQLCGTY